MGKNQISVEKRLQELDIDLPEPPKPVIRTGNLIVTSGQIPILRKRS